MSENRRYYWLKLQDNFFNSLRIKKLRRLAGGDTYTIIYLKMQLLAIKSGGRLGYMGLEDSFAKELALDLDEQPDDVEVTVHYLLSCGLMETEDETSFLLPEATENTGGENFSAKRVRECRARKALGGGENESAGDKTAKREEKEGIDYQQIADLYNEICVSYPRLRALSAARKKAIRARINSGYGVEDFRMLFTRAEGSSFLKGKNGRNWSATFDWMIQDGSMAKILDGNYDDKENEGPNGTDTGIPADARQYGVWL